MMSDSTPPTRKFLTVALMFLMVTSTFVGVFGLVVTQPLADGHSGITSAAEGDKVWNTSSGNNPPIISGDYIYTTEGGYANNSKLYKIDKNTGDVVWSKDLITATDSDGEYSEGLKLVDGTVLVSHSYVDTSGNHAYGEIEAYNADTGNQTANIDVGGEPRNPMIYKGSLFVMNKNKLQEIDLKSMSISREINFTSVQSPAVTFSEDTMYLGVENEIRAVDPETLDVKWSKNIKLTTTVPPHYHNGTLYISTEQNNENLDSEFIALDSETGNEKWNVSTGSRLSVLPTVKDGYVYFGKDYYSYSGVTSNGLVYAADVDTGNVEWTFYADAHIDGGSAQATGAPTVVGDTVYFGSHNKVFYALNRYNGSIQWYNENMTGQPFGDPIVDNGELYFTVESDMWNLDTDHTGTSSGSRIDKTQTSHFAPSGSGVVGVSSGTAKINGTVGTSDGGGVPDGTIVEAYGVRETNIQPGDAETLRERAKELRDEMRSFDPEQVGWDSDLKLTGDNGEFAKTGNEYVAVHRESDWGLSGWADSQELGSPILSAPADESFIMSVWDPSDSPLIQDGADEDLPGTIQDDTDIIVQQLDYKGDIVDTERIETSSTYDSSDFSGASNHDYARVNLPPGFYRVKAEGSPFSYVMTVGSPNELAQTITDELETEANQRSEQAERVTDLMSQDKVVELTTTTYTENGTSGKFNFTNIPDDVNVVAVQAYSPAAKEYQLDDPANASIQDLREVAALDSYNGSFYVTPIAKDVSVPSSDVQITATEVSGTPYMDPGRFQNKTAWLQELLTNESFSGTVKEYLDLNETNTDRIREDLQRLKNQNSELEGRYQELLEDYQERTGTEDPGNMTEVRLLRQAVRDLQGELQAVKDETDTEFSDGTASATIPWEGDLDPEAVNVVAHFPSEGVSKPVPDEYISVNKRAGQGDVLQIEDYPVPEGSPTVTFGMTVSGEDGEEIGNEKVPVNNPGFNGRVLSLESVSVSTLRPGPSEEVNIRVNPEDESARVQSVNATITGPNGEVNATNGDSESVVQFNTDGAGEYYVTLNIRDTEGNQWREGFALKAGKEQVTNPPSVRARDGFTGKYAVVGDGLRGGDIRTNGGAVKTTAISAADEIPGSVHFYTAEVSNNFQNTNVQVLKQSGDGEPETVRKHVKVFLHTAKITEDAVVYRNENQPLKVGGSTAYGTITCPESEQGCTIQTYTEGDGTASVKVVNNPNVIQSTLHWVRMNTPVELPALSITPGIGGSDPMGVTPSGFALQFQIPALELADLANLGTITPSPDAFAAASGGVPA